MNVANDAAPSESRENTHDEFEFVDPEMAKVLRTKTPAERLQIGFGLWRHATRTLSAHLRSQHPGWSSEQLTCEVARRLAHGSW